jgi:hypothetical protein
MSAVFQIQKFARYVHTSNSVIKGLLGKMAGLVRRAENLVVENGEVQGKTQADGVRRRQLSLGNLGGSLVSLERLVGRILATVAGGKFGEVAVVVTLPTVGEEKEVLAKRRPITSQ